MQSSFITSFRQVASRSALLLVLGLGAGSCEKILDQTPQNSLDSNTGFTTRQDALAGLRGCYDAMQSANYYGLRYQTFADLISNNIRHTGTFPTFAQISQNAILPDNTDTRSVWITTYDAIQRANYYIANVSSLSDPAFNTPSAIGEVRALRALHYMNLLGFWGGTPQGYGYTGGLGVPLRLNPTLAVGSDTEPIARASEADVNTAIRADLDFAIANIATTNTANSNVTRNAALALRARFELRVRNYSEALRFANQVTGNITTGDNLFQLQFNVNDQNQLAFFWFPAASGGRNELDPSDDLAAAHPAGDNRFPINVVNATNATSVYPAGTTRKYFTISTNSDPVNVVRYSEVALIIAEAAAQTNNLTLATTQVNAIRAKAGLAATTATTQADLLTEIYLQRRLELAHEGHHWFDLRRTNRVQTAIPAYTQTFRNLWPIPFQEILNSGNVLVQNPGGF